MKKLSEQAWNVSKQVIETINAHPFNKELSKGTLAKDKFTYYIEQDVLYLQDFARSHAMIASRVPLEFVRDFLKFADYTFIAEQELVHSFFKKSLSFQETGHITPATLSYTSYLLQTSSTKPIEVAIAAVLPCFWVYREVGLLIAQESSAKNPYARWIETYSGKEFGEGVQNAINIFDKMAAKASEDMTKKMIEAFYNSTVLEWHFWNDSYHKKIFDDVSNES